MRGLGSVLRFETLVCVEAVTATGDLAPKRSQQKRRQDWIDLARRTKMATRRAVAPTRYLCLCRDRPETFQTPQMPTIVA